MAKVDRHLREGRAVAVKGEAAKRVRRETKDFGGIPMVRYLTGWRFKRASYHVSVPAPPPLPGPRGAAADTSVAGERPSGPGATTGKTHAEARRGYGLIVAAYLSGLSLSAVGKQFGLTRERVRQIVTKAEVSGGHYHCKPKRIERACACGCSTVMNLKHSSRQLYVNRAHLQRHCRERWKITKTCAVCGKVMKLVGKLAKYDVQNRRALPDKTDACCRRCAGIVSAAKRFGRPIPRLTPHGERRDRAKTKPPRVPTLDGRAALEQLQHRERVR